MPHSPEDHHPAGWNTFSNEGLNVLVHPHYNLELRIVFVHRNSQLIDRFGFNVGQPEQDPPIHPLHRDIVGLGQCEALERDRNLAYARISYRVPGGRILMTWAQRYFDNIVAHGHIDGEPEGKFFFIARVLPGKNIQRLFLGDRGIRIDARDLQGFIRIPDKSAGASFFESDEAMNHFLIHGEDSESLASGSLVVCPLSMADNYLTVLLSSRDVRISQNISKFVGSELQIIASNRALYEKYSTKVTVDNNRDIDVGILAPVYWNISWDSRKEQLCLPASKSWVEMMEEIQNSSTRSGNGPLVLHQATAFAALSLAPFDVQLAQELITGLVAQQRKNGSIPHLVIGDRKTNLVNPPILFLAVMRTYLYGQNQQFLRDIFPALERYYDYLMDHRQGSEEYRMAWGAPAEDRSCPDLVGKLGAVYESGMDDSPAWERAEFVAENETLDLDSVGFTSLLAQGASIMQRLAGWINQNRAVKKYEHDFNQFRRSLLQHFFDPETSVFRNRFADGEFSEVLTPDSFFPFLSGRMGHGFVEGSMALFHDQDKFANQYMIPSLEKNHPDYNPDGDHWRGRVWPPLNYLVHLGLMTQGRIRESFFMAANSFMMFQNEFEDHGHVHENYSAVTGRGTPEAGTYARSCPLYSWGNLMGLMLLEEIFNIDADFRLNFGSHLLRNKMEFRNIRVGNVFYSVFCDPESTRLVRNQADFISATPAARFEDFQDDWEHIRFRLLGNGRTTIKLHQPGERVEVHVTLNQRPSHYIYMPRRGPVSFDVIADPERPVHVRINLKR